MCHVSTAYVNSNMPGKIEEKIYPQPGGKDPEEIVREIVKMSPEEAEQRRSDILGNYPNTYTFTKSMTERVMLKKVKNCRIAIVRPSIVCGAYKEPMAGWTETLSAGQVLVFALAMGLIKFWKTS